MALWKGTMLSIMGIVQLVKSIIHSMMVYSFHIYMWPTVLLKSMDKSIRNFIWSGSTSKRKLVAVASHKMCSPINACGLGLRSIRSINEDALLKLS